MYENEAHRDRTAKQLIISRKGKYCWILGCKNMQCEKDKRTKNEHKLKFPDKDAKQELYKLWYNKIKTFQRAGRKDSFQVTNNTRVNFILILLIEILKLDVIEKQNQM